MTHPDVSVATASFGYGRWIGDAVRSVAGQRGVTVEHIVHDAGSTDGTLDVLRSLESTAPLKWSSEPDLGQSDGMNRAIAQAQGEWVAWLNADEFYLPDGLAALVAAGRRSGADIVYGDSIFVDPEGRLLRVLPHHRFDPLVLRWHGRFISTIAFIVRRTLLDEAPLDVELRRIMDVDLFLSLMKKGARFEYFPFPTGTFRVHDDRTTAMPESAHSRDYEIFVNRHGERPRGGRVVARSVRAGRKLVEGRYVTQLRARRLRGLDLRWFRDDIGEGPYRRFLKDVYPQHAELYAQLP